MELESALAELERLAVGSFRPVDQDCVDNIWHRLCRIHSILQQKVGPAARRAPKSSSDGAIGSCSCKRNALETFASSHKVRLSVICLERRKDRWEIAEKYMKSTLGSKFQNIMFDMFPAVDGIAEVPTLLDSNLIGVYNKWPIQDEDDLLNLDPNIGLLSEAEGSYPMRTYEKWYTCWNKSHAEKTIEFYNKHLTLGEVGTALSHWRLANRAFKEGIDVQIIFEDDARPRSDTVDRLFREILKLEAIGHEWDLIFLRSTKYSTSSEALVAGTNLRYSGHRKCLDAYVLSRSGAEKIATSRFEKCIFPVDEFIPALFSFHPRPDVRALDCVRNMSGFVGLTFSEEDGSGALSSIDYKGSDNNISPRLLGV